MRIVVRFTAVDETEEDAPTFKGNNEAESACPASSRSTDCEDHNTSGEDRSSEPITLLMKDYTVCLTEAEHENPDCTLCPQILGTTCQSLPTPVGGENAVEGKKISENVEERVVIKWSNISWSPGRPRNAVLTASIHRATKDREDTLLATPNGIRFLVSAHHKQTSQPIRMHAGQSKTVTGTIPPRRSVVLHLTVSPASEELKMEVQSHSTFMIGGRSMRRENTVELYVYDKMPYDAPSPLDAPLDGDSFRGTHSERYVNRSILHRSYSDGEASAQPTASLSNYVVLFNYDDQRANDFTLSIETPTARSNDEQPEGVKEKAGKALGKLDTVMEVLGFILEIISLFA